MKILFTNARDESHMREWVAHHRLIGFDHIYVFDHLSITPLSDVLRGAPDVTVERIYWPLPVKPLLLSRAVQIAKLKGAEWMMYLDADEFLVFATNMDAFLNFYPGADSIGINWLMFGSNGHVKEPAGLIVDNYTKSSNALDKHVKTIARVSKIRGGGSPHFFEMNPGSKNIYMNFKPASGPLNPWPIHFSMAPAFIAHYVYQAEEVTVRRKLARPRDDTGTVRKTPSENLMMTSTSFHSDFAETNNYLVSNKYGGAIKTMIQSVFPY